MQQHVHFLGIGGSGSSAVAAIAEKNGFKITGCDKIIKNEFTTNFDNSQLFLDSNPNHLKDVDILAITPALLSTDPNNQELIMAKQQGIEVLTWQQFMGKYLEKDKFVIAVCGTHGKSTTTAMVGKMLEDAKLDPTVELGAIVSSWQKNFRVGSSKFFVTEADEFNDNFLASKPDITIITSIEMDHPEYFKDLNSYKLSFKKFLVQTKQTIIANLQDENIAQTLKEVMKETSVTSLDYTKNEFNLKLQIPGEHNILNASAVFQLGIILGIDTTIIRQSLESFMGIGRRMEFLGNVNKTKIYSDFAHHPTEIKVTTNGIKSQCPKDKILLIYQPHMYSRTKGLWNEFINVFKKLSVDKVFITDIYQAREEAIEGINSKKLVEDISIKNIEYISEENLKEIKEDFKDFDIVIFMGAGTIDKMAREIIK